MSTYYYLRTSECMRIFYRDGTFPRHLFLHFGVFLNGDFSLFFPESSLKGLHMCVDH